MTVIINGMEKPENCACCPFNPSDLFCSINHGEIDRDDWTNNKGCPILSYSSIESNNKE